MKIIYEANFFAFNTFKLISFLLFFFLVAIIEGEGEVQLATSSKSASAEIVMIIINLFFIRKKKKNDEDSRADKKSSGHKTSGHPRPSEGTQSMENYNIYCEKHTLGYFSHFRCSSHVLKKALTISFHHKATLSLCRVMPRHLTTRMHTVTNKTILIQ